MSGTSRQTWGSSGVEDSLKDFWASRPRRPRQGRKIAGVAAGIAARYRIDPILVRVAFVVAAFYGGAGIIVYLLGWLLLPEQDDEASPLESLVSSGRSSTSTAFTLLLCAAVFPAVAWLFNSPWGLVGALIVAAALVLLHRGRGHLAPQAAARTTTQEQTATQDTTAEFPGGTGQAGTEQVGADRRTPPAWDPLGAAPFAWDLPEPTPAPPAPEPPVRRPKSKIGMITLGAALVTAGGCVLAQPYAAWLTPAHMAGIVLGVLGIGMVAGSFAGGGRGLIGLAVPLAAVAMLASFSFPHGRPGPIGMLDERPTSLEAVQPVYERSMGSIDLDLTGLPAQGTVETAVDVGTGSATVLVPANADVEVTCRARTGSVECLGEHSDGLNAHLHLIDEIPDRGGLKIKLDVRSGVGDVEVRRG